MSTLKILLGISSVAVLGASTLAGMHLLSSGTTTESGPEMAAGLPPAAPASEPEITKAWSAFRSSGGSLAEDSKKLSERWQALSDAIHKIDVVAPSAQNPRTAKEALGVASRHLDEQIQAASQSQASEADQARDLVLMEIVSARADLESLGRYRDAPLSQKLKSLLILGANRVAKGIDLVWISDPSKGAAGGFWAAKRETSLAQYRDIAGRDPASLFRKPSGGGAGTSDADIERQLQDARTKFLANAPAANREAAALAFDERMAPKERARLRALAEQKAQQSASGYEKFPADLANMSDKDDSQPFLNKLQQADLPSSDWKYRLPTRAEWALLQGKVDGIGTPDLSEWVGDSPGAVDRNWKADQASTPPAPGTVGFRTVLAGTAP